MIDKQNFVEFLVSQDVLKFGTFTLNSGRQSPYFFNLGSVSSGAAYARLGAAYADAVLQSEIGRAHVRTPVTEKSRMPSSA